MQFWKLILIKINTVDMTEVSFPLIESTFFCRKEALFVREGEHLKLDLQSNPNTQGKAKTLDGSSSSHQKTWFLQRLKI